MKIKSEQRKQLAKGSENMLNVLSSYLVSLGFNVDTQSLNDARNAMGKAEEITNHFGSAAVKNFAMAAAGITAFITSSTIGLTKFVESLAMADLKNEMFARKMWTTKENAAALNNTLQAMGATIDDLYLSPELAANFMKLRKEAISMGPPPEFFEQMKFIRSIIFEFQRLKLMATYALQWIGSYLIKYLEEPLKRFKTSFKDFNDMLQKTMPHWTKLIAQVMSWFVRLGIAAYDAGKKIVELFTKLPTSLKIAGGAFGAFFTLLKMGPIGWIIAGMTAMLLLIDDYATAMRGGRSAFGDFWKGLKEGTLFGSFGDQFKDVSVSLDDMIDKIIELGKETKKILDQFAQDLGFKDFSDWMTKSFIVGLSEIVELIKAMTAGINLFVEGLKAWRNFGETGSFTGEISKEPIKEKMTIDELKQKVAKKFSKPMNTNLNENQLTKLSETMTNISKTFTETPAYSLPGAGTTNQSSVQTNTFNIYGAEKPEAAAKAVENKINFLNTRNNQGW